MFVAGTKFHDLELLNVKIDTWIDDEEYRSIWDHIIIDETKVCESISNFRVNNEQFSSIFKKDDPKNSENLIEKINPEHAIQDINRSLDQGDNWKWKSLFFAKYLRAIIQENGTDDYTKHLDDLVIYLQRKLPYQSPLTDQECVLQHLYFQELSACGMPGLESLGFALQAYNLVKDKKDTEDGSHYSFALYKLWAKYNQGIGYLHSGQKMEAADAFNEIIREFAKEKDCLKSDNEKSLWQSLLYDQAILFKAELLEDLQFSYHTVQALEKLDGRKEENSLIKKALAFRDMGRLGEAKGEIQKLILEATANSINDIFEALEHWKIKNKVIVHPYF